MVLLLLCVAKREIIKAFMLRKRGSKFVNWHERPSLESHEDPMPLPHGVTAHHVFTGHVRSGGRVHFALKARQHINRPLPTSGTWHSNSGFDNCPQLLLLLIPVPGGMAVRISSPAHRRLSIHDISHTRSPFPVLVYRINVHWEYKLLVCGSVFVGVYRHRHSRKIMAYNWIIEDTLSMWKVANLY